MHVVCLDRQFQLRRPFQHLVAQRLVGLLLHCHSVCKICHVVLQLEVVEVDGTEQGAKTSQGGENGNRSRDAPTGYPVHLCLPVSSPVPQSSSSAQISSECGVHSALAKPEICSSSSFSVPWPYGQIYSIRGRPNCRMRLHEPVSIGMRSRRRQTRQRYRWSQMIR